MGRPLSPWRVTRRDALRLLGAGAASLAAACGEPTDVPTAVDAGAGEVEPPEGPIIRTLLADVSPYDLGDGAVLMHEHLSATSPYPYEPPRDTPPHFTEDVDLIAEEVRLAGLDGVACIVDGGHDDMGRSLDALRTIAGASGVHIVASGGFYVDRAYPPTLATQTVEEITDALVAETHREGFGAYGEIGTSGEITPTERKVLTAVARAHVRTGVPIFTHNAYVGRLSPTPVPAEAALWQLDLLEDEGVDLDHLVIGHLCCLDQASVEVAIAVAARGAFVGFDRVGWDMMVEDARRIEMIQRLVEAGHADRLVLASDFYRRDQLRREGGAGYARTVTVFAERLRETGVDERHIQGFIADNPRRWLAFEPNDA